MIATIWTSIVAAMQTLGYVLDKSDSDSLQDHRYSIKLPSSARDDRTSQFAKTRIKRDVRIRLQFKDRKDTYFQRDVETEVEKVATALRSTLLYETSSHEERAGGLVVEIQFSATDSMS